MCGIYGKINFHQESNENLDELQSMMAESAYRGPDSHQCVQYPHIQLGFNRLSIIDLESRSNQPFERLDLGLTIAFNGEIYNYQEIRKDLTQNGYTFHTESDTEVFLCAYHFYKEAAFNRFIGMWAAAIYDHQTKKVILTRDRFGIKPLYYMFQNEAFYFASEMKSLLKVKTEKKLNNQIAHRYKILVTNTSSTGNSFVKDIMEFPAGNYGEISKSSVSTFKFYESPKQLIQISDNEASQFIAETFKSAVKLRMRADVPIALLLSGGLDSSAMAFVIDDMIEKKEIEVQYVHAYTLNFPGFQNNEWDMVQNNAKHLKHVVCHSIDIDIQTFKKAIPELIAAFDIPVLSVSHLLHCFAMREIKKQGFTVVLNGQGPDEVYGGYFPKDLGYLLLDYFKKSPVAGLKEMKMAKKVWQYSYLKQIRFVLQALIRFHFPKTFALLKKYQVKQTLDINLHSLQQNKLSALSYFDFISRKQVFETKFNGILQYEDMASMLNSIEMRSPFLDYRLVNFGLSLPSTMKLKDGHSKWILRKAFSSFLPENICWAGWKLGYAVPKKLFLEELFPNTEDDEATWNNKWREYNLKVWMEARGITR